MRRIALRLLPLLVLTACTSDTSPEADQTQTVPSFTGDLVFVDDGGATEGFSALRDTLRQVIARRDTLGLLAIVGPGARLSFGDTPGGPEGFRAMWFGDTEPSVWEVLARILDGGAVEEDGAVVVPAVAALWPDALDPFDHVAVPGESVDALETPGGRVLATVSRIVLPVTGPAVDGWHPVALPDGREAVVPVAAVLSPIGHRATFWDDGDGWRLRSFLAGDS